MGKDYTGQVVTLRSSSGNQTVQGVLKDEGNVYGCKLYHDFEYGTVISPVLLNDSVIYETRYRSGSEMDLSYYSIGSYADHVSTNYIAYMDTLTWHDFCNMVYTGYIWKYESFTFQSDGYCGVYNCYTTHIKVIRKDIWNTGTRYTIAQALPILQSTLSEFNAICGYNFGQSTRLPNNANEVETGAGNYTWLRSENNYYHYLNYYNEGRQYYSNVASPNDPALLYVVIECI